MTREEALLKLLAIEPERHDRLRQITGWPYGETEATLKTLERAGRIASHRTICGGGREYRVYHLTGAQA